MARLHVQDALNDHDQLISSRPLGQQVWIAGYGHTYYAGPVVVVAVIFTPQFRYLKPVEVLKYRRNGCYYHLDDDYEANTHFIYEYLILTPQRLNNSWIKLESSKATAFLVAKVKAKHHLSNPVFTLCRKYDQPSFFDYCGRTEQFSQETRFAVLLAQNLRRQLINQIVAPIYYEYDFHQHLGAATKEHVLALCREGISPMHLKENLLQFPKDWMQMVKSKRIDLSEYPFHLEQPKWWTSVTPERKFICFLHKSDLQLISQTPLKDPQNATGRKQVKEFFNERF